MRLPNRYHRLDGLLLGLVTALMLATAPQAKAETGPFAPLAGSWSGGGEVMMSDGSVDRLRCKATYSVGGGGATATLNLRCASRSSGPFTGEMPGRAATPAHLSKPIQNCSKRRAESCLERSSLVSNRVAPVGRCDWTKARSKPSTLW